jgi:hypothetical protein
MAWRTLTFAALVVALVVTSVGWYRAAGGGSDLRTDDPSRFESCSFDGDKLVLGFTYGAGQLVAPSIDTRSGDTVVVALDEEVGDGIRPAIALMGSAEFSVFGAAGDTVFEYADGTPLDCPPPADPAT